MRYLLSALFVALLTIACSSAPAAQYPSGPERAADLEAKTVALVKVDEDGDQWAFCTGVWVSQTAILTAFHCIKNADPEEKDVLYAIKSDVLTGAEAREKPRARLAHVFATDPKHDLALLRASEAPAKHGIAPLSWGPILTGERVQATGQTAGMWWSYCTGDIASIRVLQRGDEPVRLIQTTAPVWRGNSGGGLFTMGGELLGIASFLAQGPPNMTFFIHRNYIEFLLAQQGKAL